jgi:hypothetical protein
MYTLVVVNSIALEHQGIDTVRTQWRRDRRHQNQGTSFPGYGLLVVRLRSDRVEYEPLTTATSRLFIGGAKWTANEAYETRDIDEYDKNQKYVISHTDEYGEDIVKENAGPQMGFMDDVLAGTQIVGD